MPWCYIRRGRRIAREYCAVPMCKPDSKWKTSVFYAELLSDHCFWSFTGPTPTVKLLPAVPDTGRAESFWPLSFLSALLWTRPACLCRAVMWWEVWTEGQQNRERFFCGCRVTTVDCRYFWPSFPLWWFSHLALLGCYCCALFWWVRLQKHLISCCSGVFRSFFAYLKYFLLDICSAMTSTCSRYTWGRRPPMKPMQRRNRSSQLKSW